jgi:hypothetical protein
MERRKRRSVGESRPSSKTESSDTEHERIKLREHRAQQKPKKKGWKRKTGGWKRREDGKGVKVEDDEVENGGGAATVERWE